MNPILMQRVDSGIRIGKAYCPKKAMQTLLLKPDTYQKRTQVDHTNLELMKLLLAIHFNRIRFPPFDYPMPFLLKEPFAGFPSHRRGGVELTKSF